MPHVPADSDEEPDRPPRIFGASMAAYAVVALLVILALVAALIVGVVLVGVVSP